MSASQWVSDYIESKPCPFCGWNEVQVEARGAWCAAYCAECGASPGSVKIRRDPDKELEQREAIEAAVSEWEVRAADEEEREEEQKTQLAQIAHLEAMRPHWAQGFSTDSVAAQAQSAALSQLWKLLGVSNQTDAVKRIEGLRGQQ